jgi:hypothetical protein
MDSCVTKEVTRTGKKEDEWVDYRRDGTVNSERSGIFKDGKKISD